MALVLLRVTFLLCYPRAAKHSCSSAIPLEGPGEAGRDLRRLVLLGTTVKYDIYM